MALILVVDDEYLLAMMLADMLEEEGHEVDTAPNGRAALDLAHRQKPALIISDFMMPVMTGMELAEAVRRDGDLEGTPIILLSGAQGSIARDRPELFDVVLDKPYRRDVLLGAVTGLLGGKL
jgi:CheY-like chemotaxis protein